MRRHSRSLRLGVMVLLWSGCTLSSGVDITPLDPQSVEVAEPRGSVEQLLSGHAYREAIRRSRDEKMLPASQSLALGRAEIASAMFEPARRRLIEALPAAVTIAQRGQIEWSLSEAAYLQNDFPLALSWADEARRDSIRVLQWHLDFLQSLGGTHAYQIDSDSPARVKLEFEKPMIPRIAADANGVRSTAVIDSGAALSIVSRSFAERAHVQSLGDFTGTFYGLLAEPIGVSFGIIRTLSIGSLEVRNVPVAIMPDEKLAFVTTHREPFAMDILLGAHFLKEFVIELDYRHGGATFLPIHGVRNPAPDQNLFFVDFRPAVRALINRKKWYLFVVDTGSEITFLNSEQLAETPVRGNTKPHGGTLQGLGGEQRVGEKVEGVEIGVGRYAAMFRDIPLYDAERGDAVGIIGENLLKNFRVTIDFSRMRLDLRR